MRSRNIKPGFFKNENLSECDPLARILFTGLWCMADCEGYLEYRPKKIKVEILPYDSCNVEKLLEQLLHNNLIIFIVDKSKNKAFIEVPTFLDHQSPHRNEKPSVIAPLLVSPETSCNFTKLRSPLLIPDSCFLIPDSLISPELDKPAAVPLILIPLIKKDGEFEITQEDIDQWSDTFPGIDVLACVKYIRQWNFDNPKRRKTKAGIRKHISTWLEKEQNKGARSTYALDKNNRSQDIRPRTVRDAQILANDEMAKTVLAHRKKEQEDEEQNGDGEEADFVDGAAGDGNPQLPLP
ncbi:hypothetical protein KAR91_12080 [Candidatus Pacearchaeota archaeon]|nr:hypothetical protein [Candidatus Pacearchaeota archaeon]